MYLHAIKNSLHNDISLHEALSGISGGISLAAWIFLLVPQLILNYRNGNANGISTVFLSVWMMGDLTNLIGALWASLVPTVVIIAVYFCFTDLILLIQTVYYKYVRVRVVTPDAEHTRLLGDQSVNPDWTTDLNGPRHAWITDAVSFLAVFLAGVIGWFVAYEAKIWQPTPAPKSSPDILISSPIGAQILGYVSALCYLTARIPQIIKNHREKSCKGLALLFFLLSLLGNTTYGLSILFHSLQKQYLTTNLPWLIGSLGTIVEDVIIFLQFHRYSKSS